MDDRTNADASRKGTAVITGASAGLGSIYADRLAKRGYDLLLVARRGDRLAALEKTLTAKYKVGVRTLVADLSQTSDVDKLIDAITTDPSVSLLLNNAGSATFGPVSPALNDAALAMIALNISALTRLTMAILPVFRKKDAGTLINIGSVLGFNPTPGSAVYSATKAYVLNLHRGLLEETAGTGVRVQLVTPAATATEIWDVAGIPVSNLPAGTVMNAEECVDAALAGLDAGEQLTSPSVEDADLLAAYDKARMALFAGSRSDKPASRYA